MPRSIPSATSAPMAVNLGRAISVTLAEAVAAAEPTLTAFFNWVAARVNGAAASITAVARDAANISIPGPTIPNIGTESQDSLNAQIAQQRRLIEENQRILREAGATEAQLATDRERSSTRLNALLQRQQSLLQGITDEEGRRRTGQATATRGAPPITITPPAFVEPPAATRTGGGTRSEQTDRALSDAMRALDAIDNVTDNAFARLEERVLAAGAAMGVVSQRLATVRDVAASGVRPLTEQEQALLRTGDALLAGARNAEGYQSAIVKASEQSATAWRAMGLSQEEINRRINASLDTLMAKMIQTGQITTTEAARIRGAVAASPAQTPPGTTFGQGLGNAAGLDPTTFEPKTSLAFDLGQGTMAVASTFFDNLLTTLDKVAEGSVKAGEAFAELALDFAKMVAVMVAKAAALKAIQLIIGAAFGPSGGAGGIGGGAPITNLAGTRMAGGAVAGGYTYLVGERGPELFTPNGSGTITSNQGMYGAQTPSLTIQNNAPGVVVQPREIDSRTVVAAVNLARTEIAKDYGMSMRTGFGPYSETLTRSHQVRRRL